MKNNVYWVYILHCANDTYYTGYTNNLEKRYESHRNGSGKCKYTRSFKPLCIAQCWKVDGTKALAMQMECAIKKLSRVEKEKIIAKPSILSNQFQAKSLAKRNLLKIEKIIHESNP